MKRQKREGSHSDLNETGIFVFLTMVIFFVAVGFPTLINTSPTLGYEGVEWTPVTTYYQQAYAQQEVLKTLAYSNFNPVVLSAFLVMPTAIDNPPPDPAQYFELKYSQPITIEQGFAEIVRPETVLVKEEYLLFQMGSWLPMAWQTDYFYVEKSVFVNNLVDDDFIPNTFTLIPSAYGDSIHVVPLVERITNNLFGTGVCNTVSATSGGLFAGGSSGSVFEIRTSVSGNCGFTVYTINPQIPPDMIDTMVLGASTIQHRGRIASGDTNYDCGVAFLGGVPSVDTDLDTITGNPYMSADDLWFNATAKSAWSVNFNSPLCRDVNFGHFGTDNGYGATQLRVLDFIQRIQTNLNPDGSNVCDPSDDTNCAYSYAWLSRNIPSRSGVNKGASMGGEYFRMFIDPKIDALDGHWQMKEHSFYPTGTMDDCGFSTSGDLFRIDSGSTDAEQGQCMIFKTFHNGDIKNKEDFVADTWTTVTDLTRFSIDTVKEVLEIRVDDQNQDVGTPTAQNGDGIFFQLPTELKDDSTKFVLQIPYNATFTNGTATHRVYFAISESSLVNTCESGSCGTFGGRQRMIGMSWQLSPDNERVIRTHYQNFLNNQGFDANNLVLNSTDLGSAIDDGCIEISRNFGLVKWSFYDDMSCTGTPLQSLQRSVTVSGDLDFTKFSYSDLFSAGTGGIDIDIHNVTIWDGVTIAPVANFKPDISINVNASGTGSSEMRVFVDVFDGAMDMGNNYGSGNPINVISGDMQENLLRADKGAGDNHRLGIIEVDLPFEGEILLKPNYDSGDTTLFTVFVGLQDNSTDGTITLDVNSVTVGTNIYDFTNPVVRFHEQTNFASPSPIKAELDTGYVSTNVTQGLDLTTLAFYDKQESLTPISENIAWTGAITGTTAGGSGTVTVVTGLFDNALSYPDPNSNKVSQFDVPSADVTTLMDAIGDGSGLSFNYWGKHSDASFQRNIWELGTGLQSKSIRFIEGVSTPNLLFQTNNLDGTDFQNVHGSFFIDDDGQFHMYTVAFNSTHYDLYRDAVFISSTAHSVTGVSGTVDSHLGWGGGMVNLSPSNTNGCDCILDEVSVWNSTLSSSEILTLFNNGAGLEIQGLANAPPLPAPKNPVLSGTVTSSTSLDVDWVHDGINTTGYRIYRTSTEPADTKIIYDTLGTEDFAEKINAVNVSVAHSGISIVADEIISEMVILLMNDTAMPVTSDGLIRGAIFADATTSTTSNATLALSVFANGTSRVKTIDLPSGLSPFTFEFRREGLVNLTSGFPTDIGFGVFRNTTFTGDVSVGLCTGGCAGAGSGRTFDTSVGGGTWLEIGATFDVPIRLTAINQTKLLSISTPFVNDTGSLDTNFTDTSTLLGSGNTYFYRVVPLNGNIEGDTVVILNGTEGYIINQTLLDVAVAVDEVTRAIVDLRTYPDPYAYYDFDAVNIQNGFTMKNLGTAGSIADGFFGIATDNAVAYINTTISVGAGTLNSTGLLGEAIITNSTLSNLVQIGATFVVFGHIDDRSQWDFLTENNGAFGGSNLTSVSFWSNGNLDNGDTGITAPLLSNDKFAQQTSFVIYTTLNDEIEPRTWIYNNDGVTTQKFAHNPNLAMPTGDWHHYVVTTNKTSDGFGTQTVYVDGSLNNNTVIASFSWDNTDGGSATQTLILGMDNTFCDAVSDGCVSPDNWSVDELAIWDNHILNSTEIDFLFNGGNGIRVLAVAQPPILANATDTATVSDQVNATKISFPAPDPITDLTATQTNSVFLNWTAPAGTITGYKIQRNLGNQSIFAGDGQDLIRGTHLVVLSQIANTFDRGAVAQRFTPTSDIEITGIQLRVQCGFNCFIDDNQYFGGIWNDTGSVWLANSTNFYTPTQLVGTQALQWDFDPSVPIASGQDITVGIWGENATSDGDITTFKFGFGNKLLGQLYTSTNTLPPTFVAGADELGIDIAINSFETIVADTGSTVTNFTDTNCPEAMTCFYNAIALNGVVESLDSNLANATEGFVTGSALFNTTGSVWQYREFDDFNRLSPKMGFDTVAGGALKIEMDIGDACCFGGDVRQPASRGLVFKVFNKTDVIDSSIIVNMKGESPQSPNGFQGFTIKVLDGGYLHNDYFQITQIRNPLPSLISQQGFIPKGEGTLGSFTLEDTFTDQDITLSKNDIAWSNSTEDVVTVAIEFRDNSDVVQFVWTINSITVSKAGIWNFTNGTGIFPVVGSAGGAGALEENTDSGFYNNTLGFSVPPLPDQVTDLTAVFNESTQSIDLSWNVTANADSYRIFRTSTESGDEVIKFNFNGAGSPQTQTMSSVPKDFVAETRWGNTFLNEIVSRITWNAITNLTGTEGILKGAIMLDADNAVIFGDDTMIANSTTFIDVAINPIGIDQPRTFRFVNTDLINLTTTVASVGLDNIGIGAIFDKSRVGDAGSIQIRSADGTGGNTPRMVRWDITVWGTTNGQDLRGSIAVVNQTRLSADPEVSDTASSATTFSDTNIDELGLQSLGNTYFYRLVGLNALQEQGGLSNVANATALNATIPVPPTNLVATQNPTNITINWTKDPSATGYNVYRYGANDTDFAGQRNFLPSDYLRSIAENRYTPALDPLNVAISTLVGTTIYSTGINFTQSGNATLTAIEIAMFNSGACSGTNSWIPTVWNGTEDLSGDTTQLVNGTAIADCDIGTDPIFFFDDFELVDENNYIIGIQRNGSQGATVFEERRILGGGVPYGSDSLGFWLVADVTKNDFGVIGQISGHDKVMSVFVESHKKVATLGDVDTFVDTDLDEGITFFYKVRSTLAGVEGTDSDDVNATATIPIGGDIINSTSAIWQMREHRSPNSVNPSMPNMNFTITDSTSGFPLDMLTFDTGADLLSNTGDIGTANLFKVFPKADIDGSDITVFWEKLVVSGTLVDVATLSVINGTVHKDSIIAWSDDDVQNTDKETLASVSSLGTTFAMTSETILASSIDYENATDFITIEIRQEDTRPDGTKELRIANITISNVGFWDFTNMTEDMIIYTELHDPPAQGTADFGRCYVACQGQEGFHANRGLINFTEASFSVPPFEVTIIDTVEAFDESEPARKTIPFIHTKDGALSDGDLFFLSVDSGIIGHRSPNNLVGDLTIPTITGFIDGVQGGLTSGTMQAIILSNVTGTNNFEDRVVEGVSNTIDLTTTEFTEYTTFTFDPPVVVTNSADLFFGFNYTGDGTNGIAIGVSDLFQSGQSGVCIGVNQTVGVSWSSFQCTQVAPFSHKGIVMEVTTELDSTVPDFTLSGGIQPQNLVVYLSFDTAQNVTFSEGSDTAFANAGTFGHNSTAVTYSGGGQKTPTTSTGIIGDKAVFTQGGSVLITSLENDGDFDFLSSSTTDLWGISFWTKSSDFSSLGDFAPVLSNMGIEEYGMRIVVDSNQKVLVDIANNNGLILNSPSGGGVNDLTSSTAVTSDWIHIGLAVNKSDTTNTIRLYINGTQEDVAPVDFSAGITVPPEAPLLALGESIASNNVWQTKTAETIDTQYDDLCIWKGYQPTATDMSTIFNSGVGASCSTAVQVGGINVTLSSVPDQVTGLTVVQDMENEAELDWDDLTNSTTQPLDNYEVFRANATGSEIQEWQLKEHDRATGSPTGSEPTFFAFYRDDFIIGVTAVSIENTTGDRLLLQSNFQGFNNRRGAFYMFKVFETSVLPTTGNITVTWEGYQTSGSPIGCPTSVPCTPLASGGTGNLEFIIKDGFYDRFSATDFPANPAGSPTGNGVDIPNKGNGTLSSVLGGIYQRGLDVTPPIQNAMPLHTNTTSYDLNDATLGNVTLMFVVRHDSTSFAPTMVIKDITIDNFGKWNFERENGTDSKGDGIVNYTGTTVGDGANMDDGSMIAQFTCLKTSGTCDFGVPVSLQGDGTLNSVLIGSPVLSEFTDTTISPITNVLNYTVRGVNTFGAGANSTDVEFGLIQPITGLNATLSLTNNTTIELSWDLATTVHPSDPLTGVRIERAENGTAVWEYREHDRTGATREACYTDIEGILASLPRATNQLGNGFHVAERGSGAGSCGQETGDFFIMKSFPFDAINGSSITVTNWRGGQQANGIRLNVFDGNYTAGNNTLFPLASDFIFIGGGQLGSILEPTTNSFVNTTLPASSIDYSSSTEGVITVLVRLRDSSISVSQFLDINQLYISNLGTYDFSKGTVNGTNTSANQNDKGTITILHNNFTSATTSTFGTILNFTEIATVDELVTSFNDTGLAEDTTFFYRAKGVSAVSTGAFDLIVNATTGGGVETNQTEIDFVAVIDERNNNVTKVIRNVEIFSGGGGTTIFADNFTTYATQGEADISWLPQHTPTMRVNISNDELDWKMIRNGTNANISHDLGTEVSNQWLLRFKVDVDSDTHSTILSSGFAIYLASQNSTVSVTDSSFDGIFFDFDNSLSAIGNRFLIGTRDNGVQAFLPLSSTEWSIGTFFIQLERNNSTSITAKISTDADFNVIQETLNLTIPSTVTGLDHIFLGTSEDATGYDGVANGSIDDFYFIDNDFFDDFETDDFTTMFGTRVSVDTGSRVMNWTSSGTGVYGDGEVTDPIGQTIDDNNWTLRTKLNIDTQIEGTDGTANDLFIGFSDDNTSLPAVTQDWIGWRIASQDSISTSKWGFVSNDGTAPLGGGTFVQLTPITEPVVGTFFLEINRTSSTTVTATVFTDPLYSVELVSLVDTPISSGIVDLRFLKVMVSNFDGTGDSTFDGFIDDMTLINGGAGNVTLTFFTGDLVSAQDTVVITPPTIPDGITDLAGATVLNTCELSWSAPFDGNSIINGYRILRQVQGTGFNILIANTSNTNTTHIDTGLTNLILYEYDVLAGNRFGFSNSSSNIVDCMPIVSAPPSEPLSLSAVNEGADVRLNWLESASGDPTGYQIQRKVTTSGTYITIVNDTGTPSLTFLDQTVSPSTEFVYRISAFNTFGQSGFSNEATVNTLELPATPTLTAQQVGNVITLNWTEPASGQPINGYKIDKRINLGTLSVLVANTSNTQLSFTDSNVTKPNTFGYRVRALSSLGEGSVSNIVDVIFGSHTTVTVKEQSGTGFKGGGTVKLQNSTFTLNQALDSNSNAIFDNLESGNYNFTFIDEDNYILNKTFNFPHPTGNLSNSFTIFALVFDVDCPSAGSGSDVRIKVNYTDGKDITEYPAVPICDSADKVSWSVRWQGEAGLDNSTMIADFISNKFKTNADSFLVSAKQTDTIYESVLNQIMSVNFVVNNNVTINDVTINFDLFLGEAPPSGGSGGGGAPAPAGASIPELKVELLQRLTGLSVLSRTHPFASAGDVIEGSISVEWEGEAPLTIKSIDVGEFSNIIRFEIPPILLAQNIEGSGDFAKSSAEITYLITLPPFICDEMLGITQNCVNEELISIPVGFVFESLGVDYTASTSVMVDLRPLPFDLPQFQIILLGVVLIVSAIAGNFIRQRIRGTKGTRQSPRARKKKFKKKFDSS